MAEPRAITFNHRELAEILLKQQGIRKGHWSIQIRFGLGAGVTPGIYEGVEQLSPTAIIPVIDIGIKELDKPTGLSVDASKIWVKKKHAKSKAVAKKKHAKSKAKR